MNSKTNIWNWLYQPIVEIGLGLWHKRIPWGPVFLWAGWMTVCLSTHLDIWLWRKFFYTELYPRVPWLYWLYVILAVTSGLLGWALFQTGLRLNLIIKLTEVFTNAGLKNRVGKLPSFVSDYPLDSMNRKLKITTASFPKSKFEETKPYIEAGLSIYVDEIKETRERGIIELTYSHHKMPALYEFSPTEAIRDHEFLIGTTRTEVKTSNFKENPHLMIGGLSGRGKSTYLRQFIVNIYLNNKKTKFVLVDLKGGLEFQLFENLPRVRVAGDLGAATTELKYLQEELKRRFELIKSTGCKDIEAYAQKMQQDGKPVNLHHHVVVIDEVAEIFMVTAKSAGVDIQSCKSALSQISRLGRAVGINLVCATQRPDKQAIDSQVKANLSGILCFQMLNDNSSILILGNGRATDLPSISGRAIWRDSSEMIEVQTPFLSIENAEKLLAPFRVVKPDAVPSVPQKNENASPVDMDSLENYANH